MNILLRICCWVLIFLVWCKPFRHWPQNSHNSLLYYCSIKWALQTNFNKKRKYILNIQNTVILQTVIHLAFLWHLFYGGVNGFFFFLRLNVYGFQTFIWNWIPHSRWWYHIACLLLYNDTLFIFRVFPESELLVIFISWRHTFY